MALKVYFENGSAVIDDGTNVYSSVFSFFRKGDDFSISDRSSSKDFINVVYTDIQDKSGSQAAGSAAATEQYLLGILGSSNAATATIDQDPLVKHAIDVIFSTYGDTVSVAEKKKDLIRRGKNADVQVAGSDIMELPSGVHTEAHVDRNAISQISSNNAADTGKIKIEGHKVGDDVSVSTLTQSGGTASCTTSSDHLLAVGDWVLIAGANEAEYNGIVSVTKVNSSTQFEFLVDGGAASPATGTITSTDQARTFLVQEVTLNGQTPVNLATKLSDAVHMYLPKQDRCADLVGNIYVFEEGVTVTAGVPDTPATVHLMITAGKNNSKKASTALSSVDYWIVTGFHGHNSTKVASWIDIGIEYKENGGCWIELEDITVSDDGNGAHSFTPYVVIPKNTRVRLKGYADTNGRDGAGSIEGFLATIV